MLSVFRDAARQISKEAGEAGEPLDWRLQEDGSLTVILPSGKKINRPLPELPPAKKPVAAGAHLPLRAAQGEPAETGAGAAPRKSRARK